jgi:DNA-binding transcriptional LysR family regulator
MARGARSIQRTDTPINAAKPMPAMSQFDHLDLDGHLLRLLLTVLEERSVTRAAQRLGVSQSAVSHLLDKLRRIVGDPLFVKSGRGIAPTAHAPGAGGACARAARRACAHSRAAAAFDPASVVATVSIAANDLQRDLLLPALLRHLRAQAARDWSLRVIPSGVPTLEMLRERALSAGHQHRAHPKAADVLQKRLFEDHYRVFYDPGPAVSRTGHAGATT